MPFVLLFAALCSGLGCALVWIAFGGTGISIFVVYVLSGHLVMAALVARAARRRVR